MNKFILDSNIIIKLWKDQSNLINYLIQKNNIIIIKEVLEELSVKEKRLYKGNNIMSERFMKLVPYMITPDLTQFKEFLKRPSIKHSKLSNTDLTLLFITLTNHYILVTDDKLLSLSTKDFLPENYVISYDKFIENIREFF